MYNKVINETDCVLTKVVRESSERTAVTQALPRAGPRATLHFEPKEVVAAIVTCGGLCPGLNDVIKNIVQQLYETYGITKVYGIRGGYRGLARGPELFSESETGEQDFFKAVRLTPEVVRDIHHLGGTILGSSRGGLNEQKAIEFIQANGINQLYVTQRSIFEKRQQLSVTSVYYPVVDV